MSMGSNGNSIFQAHWTSVTMQIKLKVATLLFEFIILLTILT
jgi:hypothetical protein